MPAANQRFNDEGVPGWRTDRGEVFISSARPGRERREPPGTGDRVIRWTYSHRLEIYFQDETGFGRFASPGLPGRVRARVRSGSDG